MVLNQAGLRPSQASLPRLFTPHHASLIVPSYRSESSNQIVGSWLFCRASCRCAARPVANQTTGALSPPSARQWRHTSHSTHSLWFVCVPCVGVCSGVSAVEGPPSREVPVGVSVRFPCPCSFSWCVRGMFAFTRVLVGALQGQCLAWHMP